MALESGRVGVRKDQVDTYGRVAIAEDMAEHWIATKMYTAGEFVLYKNDYYKALFDNVGSAPDLFQDWELTKIGNEVSSLYDEIAAQGDEIKKIFVTNSDIYDTVNINVTDGNTKYCRVVPSIIPSGYVLDSYYITAWSNPTGLFSTFMGSNNSLYLISNSVMTITNLNIKWTFRKI